MVTAQDDAMRRSLPRCDARPTLRVLRYDLHLPVPPIDELLEEIDHPLLTKARDQFAVDDAAHERIRAIDDEVVWKVKIQRWRGAVWTDEHIPWLIAAGIREHGSADDFYQSLADQSRAARTRYNAEHAPPLRTRAYVGHLLPGEDDRKRYRLEDATRQIRRLITLIQDLTLGSLRDGHEHAVDLPAFRLGIIVRADDGHETYVAIRITGSVTDDLVAIILSHVPGCKTDLWDTVVRLPERPLLGPEQAWFNLMDPIEAAKLLDHADTEVIRT
jgi:hypothetical protein